MEGAALLGCGCDFYGVFRALECRRKRSLAPFEGEVFAQGVVWIGFPHQNAAQAGVAFEGDSHKVVCLAFEPIRALIDRAKGGQFGLFLAVAHRNEADIILLCVRIEMVDCPEAGLSRVGAHID